MLLPSWLAAAEAYEPAGGREGAMRGNVMRLAALLERVRLGGGSGADAGSIVDRALSRVSAPVRLLGLLLITLMTCSAQDTLFLMLMLAVVLVLAAMRPARGIRATFVPALGATAFALVLALPAWLLGASAFAAMVRIAVKTFVGVSLVLGVSWTLTWNRIVGALKAAHVPDVFIFTLDMALKHIEVLGRSARELSEAVLLRSVGRPSGRFQRTSSAAGIMGATFIKAYRCGIAMDEAMRCRGFSGAYPAPANSRMHAPDAAYLALVACIALAFLFV